MHQDTVACNETQSPTDRSICCLLAQAIDAGLPEARYTDVGQVNREDLTRWLEKACSIQWDYKNIIKRKGRLDRLK